MTIERPRFFTMADFAGPAPPRSEADLRGDNPIEYDSTPVHARGALATVWWRGRQWAVTEVGIERLDGTYEIPASDISDVSDTHSIAQHVCDKGWADTDDFVTAWMVALTMHGVRVPKSRVRRALSKCVVRTPEAAAAWKKPRRPCAPEQPEQPERDDALAWLWSRVDSLREALGGCQGGAS